MNEVIHTPNGTIIDGEIVAFASESALEAEREKVITDVSQDEVEVPLSEVPVDQ